MWVPVLSPPRMCLKVLTPLSTIDKVHHPGTAPGVFCPCHFPVKRCTNAALQGHVAICWQRRETAVPGTWILRYFPFFTYRDRWSRTHGFFPFWPTFVASKSFPLWSQCLNIKPLTKTESLFYKAREFVWFLCYGQRLVCETSHHGGERKLDTSDFMCRMGAVITAGPLRCVVRPALLVEAAAQER
uniref:Uncharacterized protein n=1 Tax=Molossus molossus TaxID=27622 RepID=A0A7J8BYK3_MOLMO|nr:hypothetical protein HJG59_010071 [Molossus molossus]